ncbi:MAG: CHASE2 domain-containing protein [Planctomycetota bacterium]
MTKHRHHRVLLVLATGFSVALAAFSLGRTDHIQSIENRSYDWRCRNMAPPERPADAVLVLIDEDTMAYFGGEPFKYRWPFPRDVYVPVLKYLKHAGAAAVGMDILFPEQDEFDPTFAAGLSASGNVTLSFLAAGPEMTKGTAAEPEWMIPVTGRIGGKEVPGVYLPVPELRKNCRSGGLVNWEQDGDGVKRWVSLLRPCGPNRAYPTLGFRLFLDVERVAGVVVENGRVAAGDARIPVDGEGRHLIRWRRTFDWGSFSDLYQCGRCLEENKPPPRGADPSVFARKAVFIGAIAAGTCEVRASPLRGNDYGVRMHASLYDSLRSRDLLRKAGTVTNTMLIFVFVAAVASAAVLLPGMAWQMSVSAGIGIVYLALVAGLFRFHGMWVDFVAPVIGMAVAFTAGSVINYMTEGRARRQVRRAFQQYLAPELVEALARDPSKLVLGGEKRVITAFFSDIAGFTTISETMSSHELVEFINEYLTLLTDVIMAEGGYVDKYEGDAIIAMFNAPVEEPDHALRACRAALRCQSVLAEAESAWKARNLPPLVTRIGLNSGDVVVGNMGSSRRFNYTMMGDTVNLASRLEGANKTYGTRIILGDETRRLAGEGIVARELDLLRVKGKKQPVRVFELVGLRGEVSPEETARIATFEVGLAHYRAGLWDEADAAFREALAANPDDRPSAVYRQRVAACRANPPAAGWDGVFEMTGK